MKYLILSIFAASIAALAYAGDGKDNIKFDYAASLEYMFENQEYSKSNEVFIPSMTIHAVRLTPEIGVRATQNSNLVHRLRLGVDITKHTGEGLPVGQLFNELVLYYDVQAKFRNGASFEGLAGCFSRRYYESDWGGVLFSISNLFLDNNVEGLLFKYRAKNFYTELGLDWMGMLGNEQYPDRRERFQILSSGDWRLVGDFHFKWLGSFYHFACSPNNLHVVDNHSILPSFEWKNEAILDLLYVDAGGVFTYQNDRETEGSLTFPMGFLSRQGISKWGVRLDNLFYWGDDLQPFYSTYGSELYFGEGIFHTCCSKPSISDRLVLSYSPKLAKWLDLSVAAIFDFGSPNAKLNITAYRGCQQVIKVRFNIERF